MAEKLISAPPLEASDIADPIKHPAEGIAEVPAEPSAPGQSNFRELDAKLNVSAHSAKVKAEGTGSRQHEAC